MSEYVEGNLGKNSLSEEERQDARRKISQRRRKLIGRVFGWSKLDRPLRQVKLRGLDRLDWLYRLTIVAHNLVRMRRLIPSESLAHQGRSVSGGRKSGLQAQNEERKQHTNRTKMRKNSLRKQNIPVNQSCSAACLTRTLQSFSTPIVKMP